jgi:ATP-dependent DNA helicase RecG
MLWQKRNEIKFAKKHASQRLKGSQMSELLDLEERIRIAVRSGESLYREFKSAKQGARDAKTNRDFKDIARDIAQTLVAFANSDGGELLVGVEDDGTLSGVSLSEGQIDDLLRVPDTHIHKDTPLPAPRRAKAKLAGAQILYFSVPKGVDFVYLTGDGRCLRRVDRDSVPESSETIIAHRLEDESRRWDRELERGATLADLDADLIQSVASQIAYGVSSEKCLQYLDLAEFTTSGLKLKRAAVMLFAKDIRRWHPRCQVRILTYRGTERRTGENYNVVKDDTVGECIIRLIDLAWERLTVALTQHTLLTETARFEQSLLYPQIACREALINAIVHRNYAIEGRGIEISIFHDRMEIFSPGMLLSTITLNDIKERKGVHESRNPSIARVLREVGFIREMGEGIRRIYDVMRSNSLIEPGFDNATNGFTVTLFNKSLYDPALKLWLSNFDIHRLPETQKAVLALGYGGKRFSTQDVVDRLGIVDTDEVREILTPLVNRGLIRRVVSHLKANNEARTRRIPKREIKVWDVVIPQTYDRQLPTPQAPPTVLPIPPRTSSIRQVRPVEADTEVIAKDEDSTAPNVHEIYLGNIDYEVGRKDLMDLLLAHFEVISLEIPRNYTNQHRNRGFAFATINYNGTIEEALSKIAGMQWRERELVAQRRNFRTQPS